MSHIRKKDYEGMALVELYLLLKQYTVKVETESLDSEEQEQEYMRLKSIGN